MINFLIVFFLLGSSYLSWGVTLSYWLLGKDKLVSFLGFLGILFLDLQFNGYFFLYVLFFSFFILNIGKNDQKINFYLKFITILMCVFIVNRIVYGYFGIPGSLFDVVRSFIILWMFDKR